MSSLLVGAILISFSSVMVVLAGLPPDVTGFYRLTIGGLAMLAFLARQGKLGLFTPNVLKWGLVAGVFFAGDFVFWHRSITFVGPGLSTMLGNFQVIPMAVVSALFFKERMPPRLYIAILLALAGLYLMVGVGWDGFTSDYRMGVIFGLLTAVFYALYMLSLKYALAKDRADSLVMAAAAALFTGALLGGLAVGQGQAFAFPSVQSVVAIAALALICHAVGWFLITRGIQAVRGALVGLILLLQPTLSFLWDILFFGKPVNWVELSGVGLALVGIYIGSIKDRK
ncbi:DMT family transporter [Pseudodesulfovibrio sp. S3]|uniref:DMT family transporter n=1 Tax=unclassified Pseudodesulfovibrio TaxID=2661612 RepID=UPI000FEBAC40|nr:DMT family transporter [Pseudodesulfovibrio sp. S3]MCJ2165548.1 DMT family transporter [Pseudodesulfovibrio sp. S3-i]RWU03091.1 DMT family transporter [Pseudodesulfovibrio sp. S3]